MRRPVASRCGRTMPRFSHSRTVSGETRCSRANVPVVSMTGKMLTSLEVLSVYGYNGRRIGGTGVLLMSERTRFFEVASGWIAGKPAMARHLGLPYKTFWTESIGPHSSYVMTPLDGDPRHFAVCPATLEADERERRRRLAQSRARSDANLIRWEIPV